MQGLHGAQVAIDFTLPQRHRGNLRACVECGTGARDRHHGAREAAVASAIETGRPRDPHRLRPQHERRRERFLALVAAGRRRRSATDYDVGDPRGAPSPQGRCAVGHGARARRAHRGGPGPQSQRACRLRPSRANRPRACPARSASRSSGAGTSSASTPCKFIGAEERVEFVAHRRGTARRSRAGAVRAARWVAAQPPGCTPWPTCSGSRAPDPAPRLRRRRSCLAISRFATGARRSAAADNFCRSTWTGGATMRA